ncbi:MAG: DNA replication complex GINS family protein [Candidatus Aenigmarchaeota archaeon]|nr:DNA replication complex GINS family protein [Candidatus Aenigmarchaeota archaeon]
MEIITYETIRNAHRSEKDDELQKLPDGFFESVRSWFKHKENMKDTTSLLEVENAKKLLDKVISRREKKIVLSALRTVRGDMPPVNLSNEERVFFDKMVKILKDFRNNMNEKFRNYDDIVEEKINEAKSSMKDLKPQVELKPEKIIEEQKLIKPNGKLMVKILADMPRFVGSNMQSYGPMKAGDVVSLPNEVCKILLDRKVAENILE